MYIPSSGLDAMLMFFAAVTAILKARASKASSMVEGLNQSAAT